MLDPHLAKRFLRSRASQRRGNADRGQVHPRESGSRRARQRAARLSVLRFRYLDVGSAGGTVADGRESVRDRHGLKRSEERRVGEEGGAGVGGVGWKKERA